MMRQPLGLFINGNIIDFYSIFFEIRYLASCQVLPSLDLADGTRSFRFVSSGTLTVSIFWVALNFSIAQIFCMLGTVCRK